MSNQIVITSGAKVRNLDGVLTGTAGIVNSVPLGAANGVATLDSTGKVPLSQLPASVVTYLGTWNAATNTPTLANGTGDVGDLYICNVAGTVNFGAGPITFAVGDWVIYNGSQWQKSAGSSGTVTSVAMTVPTGLSVSGSPITTSGTLAVSLASGYTIPTTSFLQGLVPYTGATQTVDLGSYDLNARGIKINGTAGTGHADFKHQSGVPTGSASSSTLYADSNGDLAWLNDHSYTMTLAADANTANRTYTMPDASGTLALTSNLASYVPYSGATANVDLNNKTLTTTSTLIGGGVNVTGTGSYGGSLYLKQNTLLFSNPASYAQISSNSNTLVFSIFNGTADWKTPTFDFSLLTDSTNRTYTFPNITGTLALLEGTQTFTGVKNFDIGLTLKDGINPTPATGYIGLASNGYGLTVLTRTGATVYNHNFQFPSSSNDYNFPSITGTIAMLEGTQTFSGAKTFSGGASFTLAGGVVGFSGGIAVDKGNAITKGSTPTSFSAASSTLYSALGDNNLIVRDSTNTSILQFQASSSYTYTYPSISGTIALLEGSQTFTGLKNFDAALNLKVGAGAGGTGYIGLGSITSNTLVAYITTSGTTYSQSLLFPTTTSQTYTFPASSGTIALTSNLSSYVPYTGATANVDLGLYSASASSFFANGSGSSAGQILLKWGTGFVSSANTSGIGGVSNGFYFNTNISSTSRSFIFDLSLISASTQRTYNLPDASGTIALTSNLSSYLPLTGGTLTGTLNGTSIVLSNDLYLLNNKFIYATKSTGATNYSIIGISPSDKVLIDASGMGTTLGGALSGTSATFSGSVGVNGATPVAELQVGKSSDVTFALSNSSSVTSGNRGSISWYNSSVSTVANIKATAVTDNVGTQLEFYTRPAAGSLTQVFTLGSTGAATFSSSVTSQSLFQITPTTTTDNALYRATNAGGTAYIGLDNNGGGLTSQYALNIYHSGAYPIIFSNNGGEQRMRILSNGIIGIGNAADGTGYALELARTGSTPRIDLVDNSVYTGQFKSNGGIVTIQNSSNNPVVFGTNNTERMRITSGGNVGIGSSSPSEILHLSRYGTTSLQVQNTRGSSVGYFSVLDTEIQINANTNHPLVLLTNGSERMRITSGGNVLIGQTSLTSAEKVGISFDRTFQQGLIIKNTSSTSPSSATYIDFYYASSQTGSISSTGTTTSFNTTSDYRLKEDFKDVNGLEKVSAIKIYDFKWKDVDARMDGVIAHELADILPYAVNGQKDGEIMQGVDYSKIVPVLVKAIQEQQAQIEELKALINK